MSNAELELAVYAKVYELLLSHPIRSAFREDDDGPEGEPPPTDPEMLVAVQADRFDLCVAIRELRRKVHQELFEGNFTDTARCALLWVLWHHQGGSSKVGEAMRFVLGTGAHRDLTDHEVEQAKKWEALSNPGVKVPHGPEAISQRAMYESPLPPANAGVPVVSINHVAPPGFGPATEALGTQGWEHACPHSTAATTLLPHDQQECSLCGARKAGADACEAPSKENGNG